ncbi:phage tail protein [Streptomyces yaizuensis]|uniref:Phage tail protein n=1 Tax=Streptomyces yaizuensis TaxID=2989713 RepID=A0ABQ5NY41_9ACTN|nr:phage tail protein [Streptomyces sp. YSPA8]GLF95278.1 phage tail protein [Streptomyces sp. YSPA8]
MNYGEIITAHSFSVSLGAFQVETVQEISGLVVEQEVVEARHVTATGQLVVKKQPGIRRTGEVTITRGLDTSSAFSDWINRSLVQADYDGARQNVSIVIRDVHRNPVRSLHLSNAWASRWEGPALQAGSSAVATERVTLAFDDINVE